MPDLAATQRIPASCFLRITWDCMILRKAMPAEMRALGHCGTAECRVVHKPWNRIRLCRRVPFRYPVPSWYLPLLIARRHRVVPSPWAMGAFPPQAAFQPSERRSSTRPRCSQEKNRPRRRVNHLSVKRWSLSAQAMRDRIGGLCDRGGAGRSAASARPCSGCRN